MITYALDKDLSAEEFRDVLVRSTLSERRPVDNADQIKGMVQNADVIFTARNDDGLLVGAARSITDWSYCTYLSCLAVDVNYQRQGIGRELIRQTHEHCGLITTLFLLSAPAAREYYPHIGMEQHPSCWMIRGTG